MNSDFIVLGAGIVGLSIARELKNRNPKLKILVIEKEKELALHSSGRNSGVLHSGIYYPPNTLKAKVCVEGSKELARYCEEKKIPLLKLGKILVPTRLEDDKQLDVLYERGTANKVNVDWLNSEELRKLEPEARSASGRALFVKSTSVSDAKKVTQSVAEDIKLLGVEIVYDQKIIKVDNQNKTLTSSDSKSYHYGHVINTTGLHADSVAQLFGVGHNYTLLPFKGLYWRLREDSGIKINHLIYPVPDLRVPFLGVHTTTSVDSKVYLGPTAVPAFGRENYHGLDDVSFAELCKIVYLITGQFINGRDGFRRLAWQEGTRYFKGQFVEAAKALLPRLKSEHLVRCDKVGIRAQMFDKTQKSLVMDFLVERGPNSTHILNAISPAWTSAFAFARFVLDEFVEKRDN